MNLQLKNTIPLAAMVLTSILVVSPVVLAEPTEGESLRGIDADGSAEAQAIRDALTSQWEADAVAAGIDPAEASADSGDDTAPTNE